MTGTRKKRSDKKENKCIICNEVYSSQRSLKEHKLNIHSSKKEKEKEYKYYCNACNIGKGHELSYIKHINSGKHKRMIVE